MNDDNARDYAVESGSVNVVVQQLFSILEDQTGLFPLPFAEGCLAEEITSAEQVLQVELPKDYKLFLELHNGQTNPHTLTFPPDQIAFLPIQKVVDLWTQLIPYREDQFFNTFHCANAIRSVFYHPGRIPIAYNEAGQAYLFIDYVPGPSGTEGQLIFNINESDFAVLELSFVDLLRDHLRLLKAGLVVAAKLPLTLGDGYSLFSRKGEYINAEVYQRLRAEVSPRAE
jgi:cell wall assembly regulator SMI1